MTDVITLYTDPEHPEILVFIAPRYTHIQHGRGIFHEGREINTARYVNELGKVGLVGAFINHQQTTAGYVGTGRQRNQVIEQVARRISEDIGSGKPLPLEIVEKSLAHHVRHDSAIAA